MEDDTARGHSWKGLQEVMSNLPCKSSDGELGRGDILNGPGAACISRIMHSQNTVMVQKCVPGLHDQCRTYYLRFTSLAPGSGAMATYFGK